MSCDSIRFASMQLTGPVQSSISGSKRVAHSANFRRVLCAGKLGVYPRLQSLRDSLLSGRNPTHFESTAGLQAS